MNKSYFIVFEGIDGSGKSSYIDLLIEDLEEMGHEVYRTKEQTTGNIGFFITNYAEGGKRNLAPETEALLFAADRMEHQKKIEEALIKGNTVVSDRYLHSSLAYQGALGVDLDWIRKINFKVIMPDLVILLDIDPQSSLERLKNRSKTVFENKDYLKRVRTTYLKLAENGEMVVIKGNRDKEQVYRDILYHVKSMLSN